MAVPGLHLGLKGPHLGDGLTAGRAILVLWGEDRPAKGAERVVTAKRAESRRGGGLLAKVGDLREDLLGIRRLDRVNPPGLHTGAHRLDYRNEPRELKGVMG